MSVQSVVAKAKERYPEQYCPEPRCLWHTGGGPCPRHAPADVSEREREDAEALEYWWQHEDD